MRFKNNFVRSKQSLEPTQASVTLVHDRRYIGIGADDNRLILALVRRTLTLFADRVHALRDGRLSDYEADRVFAPLSES